MLKPAILFKEDLIKGVNALKYSDEVMYYNGCIEDGHLWIDDSEYGSIGVYQFAIVDNDKVVGFISWRIDYYSSVAYNFGLISFTPNKPNVKIGYAVLEAMKMLREQNIDHIEFGAIEGNPAIKHYNRIVSKCTKEYNVQRISIPNAFKDRKGDYHSRYLYILLKKGGTNLKSSTIDFNEGGLDYDI